MKGLFAKQQYVGIDLGHHTIKAAQLEKTPSGWKVTKFAQTFTPRDTIKDSVVIDAPVVGLVIKELLKSHHISATSAAIGVSGGTMVVRPVRMPKMSETALRKSIRFEASRYVPNSVEDSYIDFQIVGDAENSQMDVLIAAAPKDVVDGRVKACEHAGLEVENVEVAPFATMRAVYEAGTNPEWAEKTVAIIDIGSMVTSLVLIAEGQLAMVRTIPQASYLLTETLMKQFKIEFEDAEAGKAQLNLQDLIQKDTPNENRPLRMIQPQLDELLREIRRSINYWQTQQTGLGTKQIDLILLTGGGSKFTGLDEYMSHKLGIRATKIDIFDKNCFVTHESEFGMESQVAVGLCIPLAKSAAKRGKAASQKKVVAPPTAPVEEELEAVAPEVVQPEPALEAVKKPTKKKSSKKSTEDPPEVAAPETQDFAPPVPAEVGSDDGPPIPGQAMAGPVDPVAQAIDSILDEEASAVQAEVQNQGVPAAFKPAEAEPEVPEEAANAELEPTKPTKKPLFSVFGKKGPSSSDKPQDTSKPKFSLFGNKSKPQGEDPNQSKEDAA